MSLVPRIPHADPMRFLREVAVDGEGAWTGAALVPAGSPADADGGVRRGYLVELAAQLAAATAAPRGPGGAPRGGRLVGLRSWRWVATASSGTPISLHLRMIGQLGALRQFMAELRQDGRLVAVGELQVSELP